MKLHADPKLHLNTVTAYDANFIEINKVAYPHSLLVLPEGEVQSWPITKFSDLNTDHIQQLLALNPELVIIGTGVRQHFMHPRLQSILTSQRIGVECMDMPAACRTYNILMAEGRRVLAALILET